jgi:hypothetical protein
VVLPIKRTRLGAEFLIPRGACIEVVAGGPAVGTKHAVARVYRWLEAVDLMKAQQGVLALTALMFGGDPARIQLPKLVLRRRLGLPIEGERDLVA